jgi:hypothetical protein
LLNVIVLMLKPSVGLMVLMSSPFSRFTTVVLPALSSPLRRAARRVAAARQGRASERTRSAKRE